jgi:hypothetical protein
VPFDILKKCVMNAAQAAFLAENEKRKLIAGLKKELKM